MKNLQAQTACLPMKETPTNASPGRNPETRAWHANSLARVSAGLGRMARHAQSSLKAASASMKTGMVSVAKATKRATKSEPAKATTKPSIAPITDRDRLAQDAAAKSENKIDLTYLRPLAKQMVGNMVAESVVERVSKGALDVSSLSNLIEGCLESGEFSLMRKGDLHGKHLGENYKSALDARHEVTKAVRKRVEREQTLGPYVVNADDIPFEHFACNSIGAVSKRNSTDMRPVDDTLANADITPPTFAMISIAWLREMAKHMCWWWVVDIEDAFANLALGPADRPWMLFRWYHLDDHEHSGTCYDATYMHVKGNFGPRPLPYWYTMLQLYINVTFMATSGVHLPPMGFIDDNTHQSSNSAEGLQIMQLYKQHVRQAGIRDKEAKELLPFQIGIILGRMFNSIEMTISITPDKILDLSMLMHSCIARHSKVSVRQLETVLGLWEFCLECLPSVLRTFTHNTHAWLKKLRQLKCHPLGLHFFPSKCKKDLELLVGILPHCNGKQPLQPLHHSEKMVQANIHGCFTNGGRICHSLHLVCPEVYMPGEEGLHCSIGG